MPRRVRWVPSKHVVEVVTRIRDRQHLMAPQAFERPEDDLHTQLAGPVGAAEGANAVPYVSGIDPQ